MKPAVCLMLMLICPAAFAQVDRGLGSIHDRISNAAASPNPGSRAIENDPYVKFPKFGTKVEVIQVVDAKSAIVKITYPHYRDGEWVWYQGSTKGWSDGKVLSGYNKDKRVDETGLPRLIVDGTKTYQTAIGGSKTLKIVRGIKPAEWKAMFPNSVKLTLKSGESDEVEILSYRASRIQVKRDENGEVQTIKVSSLDKASKAIVSDWRKRNN